jgi:hypothetical protein
LLPLKWLQKKSRRLSWHSAYVQVVPIYFASDVEVARYFRESRDEIDIISDRHYIILISNEIMAGDAAGVVSALDSSSDHPQRFKGLELGDLPCLWIEDEFHQSFILRLPHEVFQIGQILRTLADVCRRTKNAREIESLVARKLLSSALARQSPKNVGAGLQLMSKVTERLIALFCGVVFVTAILVIAIFNPLPTAFQYAVFRIILALAAAGFVSMTPGFIEANIGANIRAGGALAVFCIVYFYAPAALSNLH